MRPTLDRSSVPITTLQYGLPSPSPFGRIFSVQSERRPGMPLYAYMVEPRFEGRLQVADAMMLRYLSIPDKGLFEARNSKRDPPSVFVVSFDRHAMVAAGYK